MRFYKLTAEEQTIIKAFTATQKNILIVICDHGGGLVGINADDIESLTFQDYFDELGNSLEVSQIVTIDIADLEAMSVSRIS
jgi:hypothetical protein